MTLRKWSLQHSFQLYWLLYMLRIWCIKLGDNLERFGQDSQIRVRLCHLWISRLNAKAKLRAVRHKDSSQDPTPRRARRHGSTQCAVTGVHLKLFLSLRLVLALDVRTQVSAELHHGSCGA